MANKRTEADLSAAAGWQKLRARLVEAEPFVTALGVFASIAIAGFAYSIDRAVERNNLLNSQVGRSMSLGQVILNDPEFRTLQKIGNRIEELIQERVADRKEDWRTASTIVLAGFMADENDGPLLKDAVKHWLQHTTRAEGCISDKFGDPAAATARPICDEVGLLLLTGESFMDLYIALKPALYCDEDLEASVKPVAALIAGYLRQKPVDPETGTWEIDPVAATTFTDPSHFYCKLFNRHREAERVAEADAQSG